MKCAGETGERDTLAYMAQWGMLSHQNNFWCQRLSLQLVGNITLYWASSSILIIYFIDTHDVILPVVRILYLT